jgi:predicted negative regulator of RcsB-dependent stress response
VRTLALLLLVAAAAYGRDPDYDAVLKAYKKKSWSRFDGLAAAFLKEKPGYVYAHSVRFMTADSLYQRKRYADAEAAARAYLEKHPLDTLADRCRLILTRSLIAQWKYEEALSAVQGRVSDVLLHERGRALEGLRRFDEAVEAYLSAEGEIPQRSAYRAGVALFRARRYDEARTALEDFLERWPSSSSARGAREYLQRIDPGYETIEDGVILDYAGKYEQDPRFLEIREKLPAMRAAALEHIGRFLEQPPPEGFLVRFADSGSDRSGLWAQVRTERVRGEPKDVLILRTEHLVLDTHDLEKTLIHELYHCVQRERLGEGAHLRTPKWVREGCALYVAGQLEERTLILAGYVGANPRHSDPLGRLVNGLGGRHTLDDYVEDVCAFQSVEERHGRPKAAALLRKLLETPDYRAAIREVLDESFAEFERAAETYARDHLRDLVANGREGILEAKRKLRERDGDGALRALKGVGGAYAPVADYLRARALHEVGKREEALAVLRTEFLPKYRRLSTLLDDALFLELRLLAETGSEEFEEAALRAELDLEPFNVYPKLIAFLEEVG